MTAAFSMAACLIALGRDHEPALERRLLRFAILSALSLALTRVLSPEWLAVDLLVIGTYLGRSRLAALWRTHRGHMVVGAILAAVACGITLTWNHVAANSGLGNETPYTDAVENTLRSMIVWPFQAFGAFPLRQDFAPPVVYLLGAAAIAVAVLSLLSTGGLTRRWWAWFVGLNVLWLGAQFVLQLWAYPMTGPIWQGRYALPLAVVVPILLFGWADRSDVRGPSAWVAPTVAGLMGAAQVASIMHVRASESAHGPLSDGIAGPVGPASLALTIAVIGAICLVYAAAMLNRDCTTRSLDQKAS